MEHADQNPEDDPVLEAELKARALRPAEREREVRLLRRAIGRLGWSGAAPQHRARRGLRFDSIELWIC